MLQQAPKTPIGLKYVTKAEMDRLVADLSQEPFPS